MNEDARHARIEASCFFEQSLCVFLAHRPVNHGRILRCDALNRVGTYRPANEEDLGGRIVTVNTHRYLRAIGGHLCFGGIRRCRHHELLSVPVEPDGDDAGRAVAPVVGQMGRTFRLQQLLSEWLLQQANVSLLSRHHFLLSCLSFSYRSYSTCNLQVGILSYSNSVRDNRQWWKKLLDKWRFSLVLSREIPQKRSRTHQFTRHRWKKPDREGVLQTLNSRFLCFAPISSVSPQKSSNIHAIY